MKTSFYFVLWILIYPILGLFNKSFINDNAFMMALLSVVVISWLLNQIMPKTIAYERATRTAPIFEDVYTGNVDSFRKRISREMLIETTFAVYFLVTILVALLLPEFVSNYWLTLGIFGIFAFGAISRCIKLVKAKLQLKSNPTPKQCMEIVDADGPAYAAYYEERENMSYQDMLPERPAHYRAFQITSFVFAIICAILGLLYVSSGITFMAFEEQSVELSAALVMQILYGSLAAYFGIKDMIMIRVNPLRKSAPNPVITPTVNEDESSEKDNVSAV